MITTLVYARTPGPLPADHHPGTFKDDEFFCGWLLRLAARRARMAGLRGEDVEDCAAGFVCHILPACRGERFRSMPASGRTAWLIRCADNWAISEQRRAARIAATEAPWPTWAPLNPGFYGDREDVLYDPVGYASSAEAAVLRLELCGRVLDAVGRLQASQQRLFTARFLHGQSVQELAAATGRSPGAVRYALWVIRRRLCRLLEEGGLDEREIGEYLASAGR